MICCKRIIDEAIYCDKQAQEDKIRILLDTSGRDETLCNKDCLSVSSSSLLRLPQYSVQMSLVHVDTLETDTNNLRKQVYNITTHTTLS